MYKTRTSGEISLFSIDDITTVHTIGTVMYIHVHVATFTKDVSFVASLTCTCYLKSTKCGKKQKTQYTLPPVELDVSINFLVMFWQSLADFLIDPLIM